jgi:hypothetical protein
MIWRGKELKKSGEVTDAFVACATREEANLFVSIYEQGNQYARENLGYMLGYYDEATRQRLYEWCDLAHPFFGKKEPTAEEAFEAGKKLGESFKAKREAVNLTLRESSLSGWYVIERVEPYIAPEDRFNIIASMNQSRISDADVEGTAEEMLAIADAIVSGGVASFRRCAVRMLPDGTVAFFSPRNSQRDGVVSRDVAEALAVEIREKLKSKDPLAERIASIFKESL